MTLTVCVYINTLSHSVNVVNILNSNMMRNEQSNIVLIFYQIIKNAP